MKKENCFFAGLFCGVILMSATLMYTRHAPSSKLGGVGLVIKDCSFEQTFDDELPIILIAAERNGIKHGSEGWYILLAIRKAENGRPGLEFGIMHPQADDLDSQAGWAAATIVKNRARWEKAGKPDSFVSYLAARYCPEASDPVGHRNWEKNVRHWQERLAGGRK